MVRPSSPRTTQPLYFTLVAFAPRGSSPGRRPDLADTSFLPLLSPSLPRSHGRRSRRRLATVAVATVVPVSPHRAHKLRSISLDILDKPRGLGRAATPPPQSFPSSATGDCRR